MASKLLITISIAIVMSSCQRSDSVNPNTGIVGNPLEETSPFYTSLGIRTSAVYTYDDPSKRILKINLDSLELLEATEVSKPENEHFLLTDANNRYVIDFSKKHIEVIDEDGDRQDGFFSFQGTPTSAAYNPEAGILVMQDDVQSIGLLQIANNGRIEKSWLGGPLLGDGKNLVAGDIDEAGKLLFSLSDNSLASIDVSASIDAQAWVFDSFGSSLNNVHWVAPDRSDFFLVVSNDAIAIVDTTKNAIREHFNLEERSLSIVAKYKLIKPHILVKNTSSNRHQMVYIDDNLSLKIHDLPDISVDLITNSFFDRGAKTVSALTQNSTTYTVKKMRITDNLVVLDKTFDRIQGEVLLGPSFLFAKREAELGFIEKYDLESDEVQTLKGYNFDHFRK